MNSPHGNCLVSVNNDIICIKPVGSFNEEGIIQAVQNIHTAIDTFSYRGFKLLIDYSEIEGATPKAFVQINDFNLWLNYQNLIAKAVVTNLSMTLPILESRVPARKQQNDKVFETKPAAIDWLKTQSRKPA